MAIGINGGNYGTQQLWQGGNAGGIQRFQPAPAAPQTAGGAGGPAPIQDSVTFSPEAQGCLGQGPGDGKPPLGPPEDPLGLGPGGQRNRGTTSSIPSEMGGVGSIPGPGDGKPPLGPPEDPFGRGPAGQRGGGEPGGVDSVPGSGSVPGPGDGKPPLGPPEDPFGRGPAGREQHQTPQVQTLMSGIANWGQAGA